MLMQERLERAQQEQQKVVARINNLDRERQELLQLILKNEGKIELLIQLIDETEQANA